MTRRTSIWMGLTMASAMSLAGCVATATPQHVAGLFNCAQLNQAVASAANGFDDIKGPLSETRLTRSWNTDVQAFHEACVITSAQRPDHYDCFGRIDIEDPERAIAIASEELGQCLGGDWKAEMAGERVMYRSQETDAVVTLETFINDRHHRVGTLSVFQKEADAQTLPDGQQDA
ncbi:hypothetical protein [Halomonas cupida]|uniref:Uncharacterized protein n=2 Tax=Halomonas cupida TaxID=44933 RepID=A0A1M7DXG4_9GAMM|nr:hypothetical protein [Halomonas cupida]SHL84137.1 hypothetical protein SAMN05660971_01523 [Halomonas cupida]